MTKMTINLKVTPELVRWANNPAWKAGQVVIGHGYVVLDGTAHTLRQAFNAIAQMGLIDTPQSDRSVFAAYDPNGDRHQITSKDFVYNFCVAYRENGETELAKWTEWYGTPEAVRDEYEELLRDLNNDKDKWSYQNARDELHGINSLQDYFDKEYKARVVPVQEKFKAGGFDKYIVPTSSWKFMREEAEKIAEGYIYYGREDVILLEGKRE
jgi:hypothetical protein